ncbi:stress responsive alpha/beta barrel protein [Hoeflea marina]|uniref:Stress responsive alpha/beta barrel protein n=1 Tax=Hoeflea marina TaxID=274592 RepID=A0A317PSU5_9HYPH|nr:Dabb family protein [Hoeflea marina]PWW04551.1 stress responsive alpha/beta barrel protein [Hoeflea marina]
MIRHCVFIRFKPDIDRATRDGLFAEIADLRQALPGIAAVHVGANISPETGMDKGYADGFIVDFDTAEARDAYLADPGHQATGARLVAAAVGGVEGILVYDLDLDG